MGRSGRCILEFHRTFRWLPSRVPLQMPIFLDRHNMVELSAKEVAKLHVKDLEVQDKYGVKFLTYWYDAERRTTFCLVDAPDKETADKVHAEAHGHVANEMIAVDLSAVEAFLGRIQDPLSAKTAPLNEPAFRAIMFTDMVGSIEMTVQLGDTMAVELLRAHDAIIRRCLEHYRGCEVKHLGDGIMASFDDAPAAVACAIEIQEKLVSYNKNSETPIHVRIGIHAGEPVEESDDLFGSAVQMAARICDIAQADAILVSREVRDACTNVDLEFAPAGSEALKGFSEPVPLFSPAC
jgi:class 3 adenylate cyclase